MGYKTTFTYPILVLLVHNDVVVEWVDDGYEFLTPVYMIERVEWEERAGLTWNVSVERDGQPTFEGILTPLEVGSKNLPTPQRFRSNELTARLTWNQV